MILTKVLKLLIQILNTEFSKKSIALSRNVKKGEKLSRNNICFIRNMVEEGIPPIRYVEFKGKIFKNLLKNLKFLTLKC